MFHRWAAPALALALCAAITSSAAGQASSPPVRAHKLATLGQSYPNPFSSETFIPFSIDDCDGKGGQRAVSLRIYNVLAQLVATPVLHGADRPIANLRLSCGDYTGRWDGKVSKSRRPASAGVYVYELVVDGQRTSRKMFLSK
jgi:hypothetical protein